MSGTEDDLDLHTACKSGKFRTIQQCIQAGNDVNKYKDGVTPLHLVASRKEDVEGLLQLLLQSNADVNAATKSEEDTALHLLIRHAPDMVAEDLALKLLQKGADPDARNMRLRTPYDEALERGFIDLADAISGDISVDEATKMRNKKRGDLYGKELVQAVMFGTQAEIEECLRRKADVNYVNEHGAGPLHYAVTHCRLKTEQILDMLMAAEADVNLLDYEGDTALNLVIKTTKLRKNNQMYTLVSKLLERGTDPTFKDLDGRDAYGIADSRGYDDIKELLQSHRGGRRPVTAPAVSPVIEEEEPAPRTPSPPRAPSPSPSELQQTLYSAITEDKDLGEIKPLIDHEAVDVNKPNKDGAFALHLTVLKENEKDRHDIIQALFDRGADVDAQEEKAGDTALHIAVSKGLTDTVVQLLEEGASMEIRNKAGKTAFDIAEENGKDDMVELLKEYEHKREVRNKWKKAGKKAKSCIVL